MEYDCIISSGVYCLVYNDHHFTEIKKIDFLKITLFNQKEFKAEIKFDLFRKIDALHGKRLREAYDYMLDFF